MMSIRIFGEVLYDFFPDGITVLGGAPFNVAWHLQAFGQFPNFISRVGADSYGDRIVSAMQAWGMDLSGVQKDDRHPTGTVQVTFEHGEPSYRILADQAYDYIAEDEIAQTNEGGLLYHGSLALRNEVSKQTLEKIKSQHQGKVILDVNLRQPWWNQADLLHWLGDADWVKLNLDEFKILQPAFDDLTTAVKLFRATYDLEGLIVTCGKDGALAINLQGEQASVTPASELSVIDSVGAGDAFTAVAMLGIYLDWPLPLTMERAQTFASAIVEQPGATVPDPDFYLPFIKLWAIGNA